MKEKYISTKYIKAYTYIIFLITVLVFELCYCNAEYFKNIINNSTEVLPYNFSVCRIVMYILFAVLYFAFGKKFIQEASDVSSNKYKRVFIYIANIAAFLITIVAIIVCIKKPELFRGISIGIITVLMGDLFIIYVSNNHIKNVIVMLCTLGIVFCIATNFNHALDEKKHFMSAVNVSFLNFDFDNNPITDNQLEELPQLSKFTTIDPFLRGIYKSHFEDEVNKDDIPSTPTGYSPILYIPPAVGIALARLLRGSIIDLYIMGRLFNLAAYGALICLALKLLPYKKNIFFTIYLMPMLILLAGTYSIDGYCVALVAVFVAYCLKVYKESETITLKQFLIMLGLFLITLLAKSMAYVFVGLIVFILPLIKTIKKNKKYIPIMIVVTIVLLVAGVILALHIASKRMGPDPRAGENINATEQINFLITNPVSTLKLIINHIQDTLLNYNWYVMLHYSVFFTPKSYCIMFPMMLFILYIAVTENDKNFNLKEKIVFILTFLGTIASTSVPLYLSCTQIGAMHVAGYQTRYIFPVLPILLLCLSNNKIQGDFSKNRTMNIAIIMGVFVVLGLAQLILV